ncbi:MAG TPA: hypothetical protein VFI29_00485 [Hanamia sp.]|nr:hypothetical protein [Hanamia sp.]
MIWEKIINTYFMKSLLLSFAVLVFMVFSCKAQVKNASQNLQEQAAKMGSAFVSSGFKEFASYTYPLILKSMGGTARMADVLTKTKNDMKEQGMSFSNITFGEPSKIVRSGKELQATIEQHTEIKLTQGRLISTSTLIAISTDNGVKWTFIDTSNKDLATLRKALPNISPDLIIPPQQPPIHYSF